MRGVSSKSWQEARFIPIEPSVIMVFLAGVVSVATPCILPLLPPLLAGSVGSRLRPVVIVAGMALTFSLMGGVFSALGVAASSLGEAMRYFAIVFMLGFGAVMVDDGLNSVYVRYTSALSSALSARMPGRMQNGSLIGAFLLGMSLGVVWIPCVGPVLGAVLSYVAMGGNVAKGTFLLFVYALGMSVPMLTIAYGSKHFGARMEWVRRNSERIRKLAGWVIILTALAILAGLDKYAQAKLLPYFPALI